MYEHLARAIAHPATQIEQKQGGQTVLCHVIPSVGRIAEATDGFLGKRLGSSGPALGVVGLDGLLPSARCSPPIAHSPSEAAPS